MLSCVNWFLIITQKGGSDNHLWKESTVSMDSIMSTKVETPVN